MHPRSCRTYTPRPCTEHRQRHATCALACPQVGKGEANGGDELGERRSKPSMLRMLACLFPQTLRTSIPLAYPTVPVPIRGARYPDPHSPPLNPLKAPVNQCPPLFLQRQYHALSTPPRSHCPTTCEASRPFKRQEGRRGPAGGRG
ncbi:hypothetical protein HETIRDRAFT_318088 [Heterobasidion irregulare TC 32-1]|uniref:Uncharacterized protein n=1 Tax=Heterobasidion irregulare (strain TC 32-1) TaxID=747525 RepID=W4KBB3_HETIT|nr:uncharacterized protein HETIRDRAFT_318088 [Heterobasidion irregulare TC 32-1]ETW82336.1 hypothetical protein HETIRDRAFT_318088 [Heterobasidion irregulare TC 32-1]